MLDEGRIRSAGVPCKLHLITVATRFPAPLEAQVYCHHGVAESWRSKLSYFGLVDPSDPSRMDGCWILKSRPSGPLLPRSSALRSFQTENFLKSYNPARITPLPGPFAPSLILEHLLPALCIMDTSPLLC